MNDQLSQHFKRSEFTCRCGCGYDVVSPKLVAELEQARAHFNAPITIVSGARCVRHNARVGGAKDSQHLLGNAADIQVTGVEPHLVYQYLDHLYPNSHGIGRYDSFTHFDVRSRKARW